MLLWGRDCPLLALAALACLSPEGDVLVCSRLPLLSPLFCEQAWQWECFLVFGNFSLFLRLPSWDGSPSLPLLSLFLSFIFCPISFWRQWAAFLGTWCPLPVFRTCFVEFAQHSNVLSMNFWGESGLPVLFLHHLRTALSCLYKPFLESLQGVWVF